MLGVYSECGLAEVGEDFLEARMAIVVPEDAGDSVPHSEATPQVKTQK